MEKNKRIARVLTDSLLKFAHFEEFTDIRKNPSISLRTILTSVLLVPFLSCRSLLSYDRVSRKSWVKRLFGCTRKMVVSDSTISRVLRWLNPREVETLLLRQFDPLQAGGLLRYRLIPGGRPRSIGIIDGSCMGGHWLSALYLLGKVRYPAMIRPFDKHGQEYTVGLQMLKRAAVQFGRHFPKLWLLDGLYFTAPLFHLIRKLGAHVLVKFEKAEWRTVTKDAQVDFDTVGADRQKSGFDGKRLCKWSIEQTVHYFAKIPVQVVRLTEEYIKRPQATRTVRCWIITTDLSLQLEELREAAHERWEIENNLFKRLNHVAGTKRYPIKDPRAFFNFLRLLCVAITAAEALDSILEQHPPTRKRLLNGIKPTWRNRWSQLFEALENRVFDTT